MFKIVYSIPDIFTTYTNGDTWELDEPKPGVNADSILEFSASEKELAHIEQMFRGIPTVLKRKTVVWRGDFAKFIFDNL